MDITDFIISTRQKIIIPHILLSVKNFLLNNMNDDDDGEDDIR